ncbi:MAG: hypothetical protein HXY35_07810 [Chloroflexi bacterium]|nr:hypothetical protein [Chloroflexota bacterium]
MRLFLRYLLLLSILVIIAWVKIPQRYGLDFPRNPGPEFDRQVRTLYADRINEGKPEIVLLGDSTLKDAVNAELLSILTGRKVAKFDVPGSASAFWYLVLKNNIVVAEHRPRMVVIIFRDTILTAPGYRVHGAYLVQLDEFAARREPILLERAYLNQMSPVEIWAEQYFPLYSAGEQVQKEVDAWIRYSFPNWLGCNKDCTDKSMYEVFTSADLEPGQLRNAVATAEQYLYARARLDFERQVNKSFLPEMIRLTKENGIQLIVVRLKNQMTGTDGSETPEVRRYIEELTRYLGKQSVIFLDYGKDPRLAREYYKDALHLNPEGETVFTQILAEGLGEALKQDK